MLIELKDTSNDLFMINPDHIVEFCRVKNTDNYSIKSLVGERIIDAGTAIYMHSVPTLSLSIIKLDEAELARCKGQVKASTMFPSLEPAVTVIQPDNNTFFVNDTVQLTAVVTDSDDKPTWSSSDNNIATVSASGLVTFKKIGFVSIIANIASSTTPSAAILKCVSVGLTITPTEKECFADSASFQLNSHSLVSDKPVYSSTNQLVASVNQDGLVDILKEGTTNIKATVRGEEAICSVRVPTPTITLDKETATLQIEGTTTVVATVTNLENKTVQWSSDKESVATVVNGVITAVGSGQANIKASTAYGYKTVTITVEPVVLNGVGTKAMETGATSSWTVTVTGTSKPVNYISSNVGVASIDAVTGAINALTAGETTLTASVLGVNKTCTLTVTDPAPAEPTE